MKKRNFTARQRAVFHIKDKPMSEQAPMREHEEDIHDTQIMEEASRRVAQRNIVLPQTATQDESTEAATLVDDRPAAEEGAEDVHVPAPGIRAEILQMEAGVPRFSAEQLAAMAHQNAAAQVGMAAILNPRQVTQNPPVPPELQREDPMNLEILMRATPDDPKRFVVESICTALPIPERERFLSFCEASRLDPFRAFVAIVQQAVYQPAQLQKAKQILFSNKDSALAALGSVQMTTTGMHSPRGKFDPVVCQYQFCEDRRPFIPERQGQIYHNNGICGIRAAGKITAEERLEQSRKEFDREQLRLKLEQQNTADRRDVHLPPPVTHSPEIMITPEMQAIAEETIIAGECGYCHLRISNGREGQPYHDGLCGHLARGRKVPGAEGTPEFQAHALWVRRRMIANSAQAAMAQIQA